MSDEKPGYFFGFLGERLEELRVLNEQRERTPTELALAGELDFAGSTPEKYAMAGPLGFPPTLRPEAPLTTPPLIETAAIPGTTEPAKTATPLPEASIATQIDSFRRECRLTVWDLASAVGIRPRSVNRHLAGESVSEKNLMEYEQLFTQKLGRDIRFSVTDKIRSTSRSHSRDRGSGGLRVKTVDLSKVTDEQLRVIKELIAAEAQRDAEG